MKEIAANNGTYPAASSAEQWYFLGLIIILVIACIVCNSIIVAVFIVEKSIRNHANMFVLSLACADLVVGMVLMPLWIANSTPGLNLHYYHTSVDIFCCSASILNCAVLSIERVIKINFPYWYTNNVTTFRLKIVILLVWTAAVLVGGFSLLRGYNANSIPFLAFITIFIYVLPVLAIFASYVSIFFVAHKHTQSIRRQKRQIDGDHTTYTGMSEAKTAWRLSVFILVFIICWTPFFIKIWGSLLFKTGPVYFSVLANTLTNINAAINPFLYALFNPLFRKGMVKLYKRKKRNNQKMGSIRRNDNSTAQTNINNSPSVSRPVSTQCSPLTERREVRSLDLRQGHQDTYEKPLISPRDEHEQTNNKDKNISNKCRMYETSL